MKHCSHMIEMLLFNRVIPVVVFDGAKLPSKQMEDQARSSSRKENLALATQYLQRGDVGKANDCFQQAVSISRKMVLVFMQFLDERNVEYMVAPYEADSQMAYLAKIGYVDAVITEDSDLIAYATPKVCRIALPRFKRNK